MVDKRSHTIHNKNRRKMVRRPTRYKIINVKKHSDTQHKIVTSETDYSTVDKFNSQLQVWLCRPKSIGVFV